MTCTLWVGVTEKCSNCMKGTTKQNFEFLLNIKYIYYVILKVFNFNCCIYDSSL
jgi:hypothetical protein